MPHVSPGTIALVGDVLKHGAGIVIPTFKIARGHPVAFAAEFLDTLMALRGDQGARSVVATMEAADPRRINYLPVDDAGQRGIFDEFLEGDFYGYGSETHALGSLGNAQ